MLNNEMETNLHVQGVGPVQAQEVGALKGHPLHLVEGPNEINLPPQSLVLDCPEHFIVFHNPPRDLPETMMT